MNQNLEIEYKNLISASEYQKLITAFNFEEQQAFVQENCYFDSEEMLLKQHHMALRIRIKQNFAEITLKSPYKGHLLETNQSLNLEDAKGYIESGKIELFHEISQILKSHGIDPALDLHMITRLKTKRMEKQIGNCLLVLDHSWYAGQEDYELEVESKTAEEGKQFISDLRKKYQIPERITPNKISRALNATENNHALD